MKITKLPSHIDNINTLQDVYKYLKIKEEDVIIFKNPKNKFEKYVNACSIIPRIVECYNNGWIPDWTNNQEYKYLPWYKYSASGWLFGSCSGWSTFSDGPSGLHYKSSDLCKEVCSKFNNIYVDYFSY